MSDLWIPAESDLALTLREPRLLVPGTKPAGPVRIDWSNPLTEGLHSFYAPEFGVDLATGRVPTINGDPGHVGDHDGLAWNLVSGSSHYIDLGAFPTISAFTIGVIAKALSGNAFYCCSRSGSTSNGIDLLVNSSATGVSNRIGTTTTNSSTPIWTLDIEEYQHITAGWTTGSKHSLYIRGDLVNQSASTVGGSIPHTQNMRLSSRGTLYLSQRIKLFYFFTRELSADEIARFVRNPMQILRSANDTPFLISVPAGGGVTGTGALVGAGSEVVGTGTRTVTGAGTLEGQGAAVVGTGERTITGAGALIGQGSDVAGTGATGGVHTGIGDLVGAGSEIVGVGERTVTGTGVLVAQGSAVVGVGERTIIGSGDLVGAGAEVSGSGAVGGITTGTGDLVGAGSEVVGTGLRTVTGSGALVAQGSSVTGTGERIITGAGALIGSGSEIVGAGVGGDATTGAGALVGHGSAVIGTGTRTIIGAGELVAAGSIIVGAGVRTITGTGALVGAGSEVVGRQTAHDFATGNTNIWMLGPRGRVWDLENRDPYDAHKRGREVCSS